MVSLAVIATFIAGATALGINCQGSACEQNDAKLADVLAQVKQMQAQGKGRRHLKPDVQIACAQNKLHSICAFYQRGSGGSVDDAVRLLQELYDHKCQKCGNVPTHLGNDVSKGELTVDIVPIPCCKGICQCPI